MKTTTLLITAALALTIHSAKAFDRTWTGATDGNWDVNGNWTPSTFPSAGDTGVFDSDVTNSTVSMNSAAISLTGIRFDTSAEAFTFNAGGGSLQLGAIVVNSSVGAVTQTFNLAVNIGSTSNFTNSSTSAILDLSGGVNNISAPNRTVNFHGVGTISVNGLTETGGGTMTIVKNDSGKLILTGTTGNTGTTQIRDGILQLNDAGALGSGNLQFGGGVIGLGSGDFTLGLGAGTNQIRWIAMTSDSGFAAYGADRNVNLGGAGGTFVWDGFQSINDGQALILGSVDSTHKVTFQNGLNLADAARTIVVNDGTSSTNVDGEISGVISSSTPSSGSMVKTGAGTLLLSAANTYTGLSTVSAGTLLVNGSLAGGASVASDATLGGTGSIAGAVTIQDGGRLAPGNSPGILTVSNDVTIEDGGIFSVEVNGTMVGTGYDRLVLTGAGSDFSLTGTNDLEMSLGFTPSVDDLFFLTDNGGGSAISGIFESLNGVVTDLSQGALFSVGGQGFNISYTGDLSGNSFTGGDDLVIQAVPEPSTWLLLTAGLTVVVLFRRRRAVS